MNLNNPYTFAATTSKIEISETSAINIGQPGELTFLFELLFCSKSKMRLKNRNLLQILHGWIKTERINLINRFLNDDAILEFHPSLQKTSVIICSKVNGVDKSAITNIEKNLNLILQQKYGVH